MIEQTIQMPLKAQKVIGSKARYKVLEGGRGSGKSYSFADALLVTALYHKKRILCTREMQNSIRDSVHRLLQDRIYALGLVDYFDVYRESIVSKIGSEFIFKGLRMNISEIKSTEGIDICWVEEAEKVTGESWDILIPTIRNEGSEIWVSFNPDSERSATYRRFITEASPDCVHEHMTFEDNEFFPEVLRREMEYCKSVDYDKFEHIWLGQCKGYSEDCIFKGKVRVEDFETPEGVQLLYGADFGFSKDPSCLIRMFIQGEEGHVRLFIDHEAYGHGVEITELPAFFRSVPGTDQWTIVADSERPDTISYLHNEGFEIEGAEKGKGSVEDGIQFIRGFEEIIIHPRCVHTKEDFENYRWKRDKVTEEILAIPKEGSDHAPDAVRYALEKYCKRKISCWDVI